MSLSGFGALIETKEETNMATARITMAPMKAAQISKPGAEFEIVEREIPKPGVGQVRIKVQACDVCHSDVLTKEGQWPGIQFPRLPGHEVAGIIDDGYECFRVEDGTAVSASDSMAAGTAHVPCAGGETFATAGI